MIPTGFRWARTNRASWWAVLSSKLAKMLLPAGSAAGEDSSIAFEASSRSLSLSDKLLLRALSDEVREALCFLADHHDVPVCVH